MEASGFSTCGKTLIFFRFLNLTQLDNILSVNMLVERFLCLGIYELHISYFAVSHFGTADQYSFLFSILVF